MVSGKSTPGPRVPTVLRRCPHGAHLICARCLPDCESMLPPRCSKALWGLGTMAQNTPVRVPEGRCRCGQLLEPSERSPRGGPEPHSLHTAKRSPVPGSFQPSPHVCSLTSPGTSHQLRMLCDCCSSFHVRVYQMSASKSNLQRMGHTCRRSAGKVADIRL